MDDRWPELVEATWKHFLLERFTPYMQGALENR
jgi:hypothetical protein